MKKIIFLCFLLLGVLNTSYSQSSTPASTGMIKGSLLDKEGVAISYASISLSNEQQAFFIGTISSEKGGFKFDDILLGQYQLEIQFLGYKTITQSVLLTKKNKKIDLGKIQMIEDQQQLEEVIVTAEKSAYSLKLDKKVFNVGTDILSQSGSAMDVLDQVPLVSVDPSGTVSLRGSSQVQILINGKRSGLTMNNALDQIPSENIERVEVITNPSAGFDANGTAGIINIILKKNKDEGLNGQIRTVVGIPAEYNILPSINYKNKRLNLFSTLRWRYSDYNGKYTTDQWTKFDNRIQYLNQVEDEDRHDDGRSGYFGGDFYLNDYHTFTLAYYRSETKDTDQTLLNYELRDDLNFEQNILRNGNSVEHRNYNQLEANYTRTFEEKAKKLTIDFQYDFWNSNKKWNLLSTGDIDLNKVTSELSTNTKSSSKDFSLKADYVDPIKKAGRIQTGIKLENRLINNDYLAEHILDDRWTIYNGIDNNIDYSEKIVAGYIQFSSKIKELEYMIGLRSELSLIDIEDQENSFSEKKEYLNLFPSAHLSYALNEQNKIQWSYSRRINRPSLWNLFPFTEIKDFNLQEVGNPNLNPSFTNAVEISFISIQDKLTINPSIYYRHTTDPFQSFLDQDEQQTFIIKPINIDEKESVGFELSMKYQPFKFIRFNGEFDIYHFDEKGNYLDQNLDASATTWRVRLSANIRLPKAVKLQTRFSYWASEQNAQTKELASYDLSFGLSRNFLKDKLNISLRGINVLDSRIRRSISESTDFYVSQSGKRIGPRYSLSFVYKINQTARQRMRQQKRQNR